MKSDAFDKIPEYDLRNKQDPYENEIGYSPKLEGDDPDYYGFRKLSGKETLYDVGFTLIGVQGGRYHGAVTEINENEILVVTKEEKDETGETVYITEPMDVNTLILGDYITYIGTETDTNLVEGGRLTTSTLYEWVGKSSDRLYMWKQDVMSEHCGGSLSDALAVSNESLAKNNSTAFQFLDHLTANSIFVNKLVANDAFIKNLFVKQIELQTEYNSDGTVKQYGAIYGGNRYNADGTIKEGSTEETEGFHISSSGLMQSNRAKFSKVEITDTLVVNNGLKFTHYISGGTGTSKSINDIIDSFYSIFKLSNMENNEIMSCQGCLTAYIEDPQTEKISTVVILQFSDITIDVSSDFCAIQFCNGIITPTVSDNFMNADYYTLYQTSNLLLGLKGDDKGYIKGKFHWLQDKRISSLYFKMIIDSLTIIF